MWISLKLNIHNFFATWKLNNLQVHLNSYPLEVILATLKETIKITYVNKYVLGAFAKRASSQ